MDSSSPIIGTLSEKTIHAVLKNYMDSNPLHQEQKFEGYVADIYDGSAIVEVQTRSFDRLRDKLEAFLKKVPVTIVHPVAATKYLSWVDPDTGEILSRRKSPKQGRACDVMREMYKVKMFLKDPNIHFHFMFLNLEEYRLQNGYARDGKKGSTRLDRFPLDIAFEILIDKPEDYRQFVPDNLEETFTSKDFAKAAHITKQTAGVALNILNYMECVKRVGKKGNAYIYKRTF